MTEMAMLAGLPIGPRTLQLLGGPGVLRPAPVATRGVREQGKARSVPALALKYRAVEKLGSFYECSPMALMQLIRVNERTAQRRKEEGALTPEESDRLARLARVTQRAIDALGDEVRARGWLTRPNRSFGGVPPLELLGTDGGAEVVNEELGRIEFGDLY